LLFIFIISDIFLITIIIKKIIIKLTWRSYLSDNINGLIIKWAYKDSRNIDNIRYYCPNESCGLEIEPHFIEEEEDSRYWIFYCENCKEDITHYGSNFENYFIREINRRLNKKLKHIN
jgi:hypothetical protein